MFDFFMALSISDKIQLFAIAASTLISVVSIFIALATLKQNSYFTREASKANIVFYIDKRRTDFTYSLVIKNFGSSSGKVLKLDISPELSYEKTSLSTNMKTLADYTNIFLAPGQSVSSIFDFEDYDTREFEVKIKYETLGKIYNESYTLNFDYRESVLTGSPTIKDTTSALKYINESIRELSDKLT